MDWSYPPEKSTCHRKSSSVLEPQEQGKRGRSRKSWKNIRKGNKKGRVIMGRTEGSGSELDALELLRRALSSR